MNSPGGYSSAVADLCAWQGLGIRLVGSNAIRLQKNSAVKVQSLGCESQLRPNKTLSNVKGGERIRLNEILLTGVTLFPMWAADWRFGRERLQNLLAWEGNADRSTVSNLGSYFDAAVVRLDNTTNDSET